MKRLDVGDVIGSSIRLVLRNLGAYTRTMGVPIFAASLLSLALTLFALPTTLEAMTDAIENGNFDAARLVSALATLLGVGLLVTIASTFIQVAAYAMGFAVTSELMHGREPTLQGSWDLSKARYWNLFGTGLLFFAVILGIFTVVGVLGFAFFAIAPILAPIFAISLLVAVVATIYLVVVWTLASAVSVFEQRSARQNLERSYELTKGVRGQVFLLLVLFFLVAMGIGIVVGIPTSIVTSFILGAPNAQTDPAAAFDAAFHPATQIAQWFAGLVQALVLGFLSVALWTTLYQRLTAPPPAAPAPPAEPPATPPADPPHPW